MANNRNENQQGGNRSQQTDSIGNQQRTTQTGAQNAGGQDIDQQEDRYTEDLQQSGRRSSSNRDSDENSRR